MRLRRNAAMPSHEAASTAFDVQYPAMAKASADHPFHPRPVHVMKVYI